MPMLHNVFSGNGTGDSLHVLRNTGLARLEKRPGLLERLRAGGPPERRPARVLHEGSLDRQEGNRQGLPAAGRFRLRKLTATARSTPAAATPARIGAHGQDEPGLG